MTIFINFDVETTGQTPTHHDLLSLGAVVDVAVADDFTDLVRMPDIGEFSVNIYASGPNATGHNWDPQTKEWWHLEKNAEALAATLAEPRRDPSYAMKLFMDWIEAVQAKAEDMMTAAGRESWKKHQVINNSPCPIVFVAYPITFDLHWLRHYAFTYEYERFSKLGWSMFGGFDLLTHKSVLQQRVPHRTAGDGSLPHHKELMKPFWTPQHVALNDARAQAALFKHLLKASKEVHDAYVFERVRQGAFAPQNLPLGTIIEEDGTERPL